MKTVSDPIFTFSARFAPIDRQSRSVMVAARGIDLVKLKQQSAGYAEFVHKNGLNGHQRIWEALFIIVGIALVTLLPPELHAQRLEKSRPSAIVLSPVPIWTESAIRQAEGKRQAAALYDVIRSQLVMFLPGSNGSSDRQVRLDIANATKAIIATSLSNHTSGAYEYHYSISDAPDAPQRCKKLTVLLPTSDDTFISQANEWSLSKEETEIPDRANAVHLGKMSFVSWEGQVKSAPFSGISIRFTSSYSPGFTDAFVSGNVSNPINAAALSGLPEELAHQASGFLSHGVGDKHHLMLAPMFRPGTTLIVKASNIHYGLSALFRSGSLTHSNAFSETLLHNLEVFLASEGSITYVVIPDAQPVGSLEASIHKAVLLSLT